MYTTSAFPEATISSIMAGSVSPPMAATGLSTCFLISAARYTFRPWSSNMEGWVIPKVFW